MTNQINSSGYRANILSSSPKYFRLELVYFTSNSPYQAEVFGGYLSETCTTVTTLVASLISISIDLLTDIPVVLLVSIPVAALTDLPVTLLVYIPVDIPTNTLVDLPVSISMAV